MAYNLPVVAVDGPGLLLLLAGLDDSTQRTNTLSPGKMFMYTYQVLVGASYMRM